MLKLFYDYETRSRVDLVARGLPRYAASPTTQILCMAWAVWDTEVHSLLNMPVVHLWAKGEPDPVAFFADLERCEEVHAWNAPFEKTIATEIAVKRMGWPEIPEYKWRCSMAKSRYNNLPGGLDMAGQRLKIKGAAKDKEGKAIMMKLTKPNRKGDFIEDEQMFKRLHAYNRQDVRAEMAADANLIDLPPREQLIWELDRRINERGVPIDMQLCNAAYNMAEEIVEKCNLELERLTGGKVTTTTQVAKLLSWVQDQGVNIAGLTKQAVQEALDDPNVPPGAKRALQLRQIGAPASIKKFKAAVDFTSEDGRAREQFAYYQAGTGRWAGRSIQLQNLFRTTAPDSIVEAIRMGDLELLYAMTDNPMMALQSSVRAMVCAPDGYELAISDLSGIEARVLLWAARSRRGLQVFRDSDADPAKPDIYRVMAGKIFNVDPVLIPKKGEQRGVGKAAILGLGYGMGSTKFQSAAKTLGGVELDAAMCEKVVAIYRKSNPEVTMFWRNLQEAFTAAVGGARNVDIGAGIVFSNVRGRVAMRLPSGRSLFYHEPAAKRRGNIEFTDSRGVRIETWGGLLAENAVQAISRDLIAESIIECFRQQLDLVLHVHDELVIQTLISQAKLTADKLHAIMKSVPAWANGLPLAAETHISKRLTK